MKSALIELAAGVLLLVAAFFAGHHVASVSWQAKVNGQLLSAEQAHAKQLEQVISDASANAQLAVDSAQANAEQIKRQAALFDTLQQQARTYVQANPQLANGCRFGSDVLRVWRAANAGQPTDAAPGPGAGGTGR